MASSEDVKRVLGSGRGGPETQFGSEHYNDPTAITARLKSSLSDDAKTIGSFKRGGTVPKTRAYKLHAGEQVVPAQADASQAIAAKAAQSGAPAQPQQAGSSAQPDQSGAQPPADDDQDDDSMPDDSSEEGGTNLQKAYSLLNERIVELFDGMGVRRQQRGKEWQANKGPETVRALADATALLGAAYGAHKFIAPVPEADAAIAAPEAEAVGSPSWLQRMNPFRTGGTISRLVSPTAAAQPEAQTALRTGATASATDAGVTTPVTATPGAGIRTLMEKPIAQATQIEDQLYTTVNKAAGTDMKSLYDRQEELQDALDDPTQIHNKTALQAELKENQTQIMLGESNVQKNLGTSASTIIDKAKAATQQRFAMETGDAKLFNNESVVKGNVAHGSNETINVDSAIRQAEILDKPSKFAPRGTPTRLQQMFGEDGAKAFKQGLYDAQKSGQKVMSRNSLLKLVGVGGGLEVLHLVTR